MIKRRAWLILGNRTRSEVKKENLSPCGRVIRFWNKDILNNLEGVLEMLLNTPHPALGADLSHKGRGGFFSLFDLTGRKALVTGATGGIGAVIAAALHQQGAIVGISGTREAALEALAQTLKERVHVLPARLDTAEGASQLIQAAEAALNGVDILVSNAGLTRDGLMMRMKDEDWEQVIQVNLTATFKLCREVIKGMMKRRRGRIINISSIVGVMGNAGQTNYVASKAGLIGLSKALALEVASRGITVNCIAPGFIETPMTAGLSEAHKEKLLGAIPLRCIGTPQDVAAGVVYLASEAGRYMTGQTLHINGGMLLV